MKKTIAFFGYSFILDSNDVKQKLFSCLHTKVRNGYKKFLIGTYGEFDKLVLQCCVDYKKIVDSEIEIIVIYSKLSILKNYDFNKTQIERYKQMGCKINIYEIEEIFYKRRIEFSNQKMVEESDLIVCYVDMKKTKSGGKRLFYTLKEKESK